MKTTVLQLKEPKPQGLEAKDVHMFKIRMSSLHFSNRVFLKEVLLKLLLLFSSLCSRYLTCTLGA